MKIGIHVDSLVPSSGGQSQTLFNGELLERLGCKVFFVLPPGEMLAGNLLRVLRLGLMPKTRLRRLASASRVPHNERKSEGMTTFWKLVDTLIFRKYQAEDFELEIISNPLTDWPNGIRWEVRGARRPTRIASHYASCTTMEALFGGGKAYVDWLENLDFVLFESSEQAEEFSSRKGESPPAPLIIRPAIDEAAASMVKAVPREEAAANLGMLPSHIHLMMVASLQPRKNQKLAIEAMDHLLERLPNTKLHLIGDDTGEYADECRVLIRELGLDEAVKIWGHRSDFLQLIRAGNLYLNLSHDEGVSLALRQAVFLEIPTLVSAIPGNLELVGGDSGALVMTSEDPLALANLVFSSLDSPQEGRARASHAYTHLVSHYSEVTNLERWSALTSSLWISKRRTSKFWHL
jgi:glycosyltransferase involved in cell wall biosynthesis